MATTPIASASLSLPSRAKTASLLSILPQGEEKNLKQAFYNTAATLFVILVCCAGYAVYLILETFLKPLLWAGLVGTFLHPFKLSFTRGIRGWLNDLHEENVPFIVGLLLLPFRLFNQFAEKIYLGLTTKWKILLSVSVSILLIYCMYYYSLFNMCVDIIQTILSTIYSFLSLFSTRWMYTLVVGYMILVGFYATQENKTVIKVLGIPVWLCFMLHLISLTGSYQGLFLGLVIVFLCAGIAAIITDRSDEGLLRRVTGLFEDENFELDYEISDTIPEMNIEKSQDQGHIEQKVKQENEKEYSQLKREASQRHSVIPGKFSDYCFIGLLWYVVAVRLWCYIWLVQLLTFPLAYIGIKRSFIFLKSHNFYLDHWLLKYHDKISIVKRWSSTKIKLLLPDPIFGLLSLLKKGDEMIVTFLEERLDKIMSVMLIIMMLVGTVIFATLLSVKVHEESMQLVHVIGNAVDEAVRINPNFHSWLPEGEELSKVFESALDKVPEYGQQWILSMLDRFYQGEGEDRIKLEKQLLQLWDRTTASLMNKTDQIPVAENKTFSLDFMRSMSSFEVIPLEDIMSIIKDNVEPLASIVQSIYAVIISNINVAASIISAIIHLLLGGGSAVLNFVISTIIFMTTLWILLSSSRNQYLPVEWVGKLIPQNTMGGQGQLSGAVEEAISGVFMASLKMAAFYGLYTWHTYILFGCKIVFIPAALACVFAVVPVLGTYWVFLPGSLELYLSGQPLQAILLAVFQFLPSMLVDASIYTDIKGAGHPYLTGLAIAGGMFWLGIEGAIVGPILLCCLIAAVNMYSIMINSDEDERPTATHKAKMTVLRQAKDDESKNV